MLLCVRMFWRYDNRCRTDSGVVDRRLNGVIGALRVGGHVADVPFWRVNRRADRCRCGMCINQKRENENECMDAHCGDACKDPVRQVTPFHGGVRQCSSRSRFGGCSVHGAES